MLGFHFGNAFKNIRRSPMSSLIIILSIALGIAVTITMISFYHGMRIDPIPHKSDSLYRVLLDNWGKEKAFMEPNEPPPVMTLRDTQNLLRSEIPKNQAAMYHAFTHIASTNNEAVKPARVSTRFTTQGFFTLFEPPFLFGAGWDANADASNEAVVVISNAVNNFYFGGSNSVGANIEINGRTFQVIGVLDVWEPYPVFYDMVNQDILVDEIFMPFSLATTQLKLWPSYWKSPVEHTESNFDSVFTNNEATFVQYWVELDGEQDKATYLNFLSAYVGEQKQYGRFPRPLNNQLHNIPDWIDYQQENGVQRVFIKTLIVVSLLFFTVCLLNIITLLMTRFMGNTGVVSLMRALGAPKSAIFFEHMLEVGILGIVGGALGLLLTKVGLVAIGPLFLGSDHGASTGSLSANSGEFEFGVLLDGTMIVTAMGLAIVGAILVALYPTLKICRLAPAQYLKSL